MIDKPHISATQVGMLCRCGEQYRRRYIEHETIPPGIRLLVGSGFHAGAEVNMRQKIESHTDMRPVDIADAAVAGLEERIAVDGYELTSEEASRGQAAVIGDAKAEVAALAEMHAREQAPEYQPVIVEETCRIVLPRASRDLLGVIDLADDKDRIIDWKTAGRKKPQSEVDQSLALTIYAAAFQAKTQRRPSEVRLDILTTTKKPTRQVLSGGRDQNDIRVLAARLDVVIRTIEAGIFLPANVGDWVCSPKWCGYWGTCPYVNSERRDAAEKAE